LQRDIQQTLTSLLQLTNNLQDQPPHLGWQSMLQGMQRVYGIPDALEDRMQATGWTAGMIDGMPYVILPDTPGVYYITGGAPEGAQVADDQGGDEADVQEPEAEDGGSGQVGPAAIWAFAVTHSPLFPVSQLLAPQMRLSALGQAQ
jgi:hypothetical protein